MEHLNNLKAVFDHFAGQSFKVDRKFVQSIRDWKFAYQRLNPEHIGFYSSAYFGYNIPRWTTTQNDYWFDDILKIDEQEVAEYAHRCPHVDKDHLVSSNILSIGMLYIMHRIRIEKNLSDNDRTEGMVSMMEILCCRYLASIMSNYFNRGPTSLEIAQETFNRLSRRYDLKVQGSWAGFVKARSESLTLGEHVRAAKFSKQEVFDTFGDERVVRKLNAIKTSLNKAIVEINEEFRRVLNDKDRTTMTSMLSNGEDGLYVKDILNNRTAYLAYQEKIFGDKQSFLKPDLLEVIEDSMETISSNIFQGALHFILDNQDNGRYKKDIAHLRTTILLYAVDLIQEEGITSTDIAQMAFRFRQNFMSGKANDKRLVDCRKITDKLIVAYRPKSRGKVITLERVSIMMYIALRTLLMQHYS